MSEFFWPFLIPPSPMSEFCRMSCNIGISDPPPPLKCRDVFFGWPLTVLLCRKICQFFFYIKWWTKGTFLKIINLYASFMKFSEHSWSNVRCDFVCQPGRNFTPWISVCHIADFAAFLTINWLDQKTWNRKNDAERTELKIHGCQIPMAPVLKVS